MNTLQKMLIVAVAAVSMSAHAGFVATDWQAAGDGKATLHTETGLEWLDLKQTAGKSINDVKALLGTTYAGWRMPTFSEVYAMASAMFPVIKNNPGITIGGGSYQGADTASFQLFGANVGYYTYGLYEKNGSTYFFGAHTPTPDPGPTAYTTTYFDYFYDSNLNWKRVYEGVFLVNDGGVTLSSINDPSININNPNAPINTTPPVTTPTDVSAPWAPISVGLSMIGLFAFRRKNKHQ